MIRQPGQSSLRLVASSRVSVRRDSFNEEPWLRRLLHQHAAALEMPARCFRSGNWAPYLLRAAKDMTVRFECDSPTRFLMSIGMQAQLLCPALASVVTSSLMSWRCPEHGAHVEPRVQVAHGIVVISSYRPSCAFEHLIRPDERSVLKLCALDLSRASPARLASASTDLRTSAGPAHARFDKSTAASGRDPLFLSLSHAALQRALQRC